MSEGLVYIGKIVEIQPIPEADLIVSATVICGKGGKWKAVIRKDDFSLNDKCMVYLPDSVIPKCESMKFMEKSKWRVRMFRFKGAPSEVLVMPVSQRILGDFEIGLDCTGIMGVTKYHKPVPANLQGKANGEFPGFIPKTDEPNYQRSMDMVQVLNGKPYFVTEKADGSSTTAFKYKGRFGLCSRNWELQRDDNIGYWQVAIRHNLEERLPEGVALQWETCGPKIQSNPMGLTEIQGYAFSAYDIQQQRYFEMHEFVSLCNDIGFPTVKILDVGTEFDAGTVTTLGEGTYENGKQREGVVVRSCENYYGHKPISFKVINLNYKE